MIRIDGNWVDQQVEFYGATSAIKNLLVFIEILKWLKGQIEFKRLPLLGGLTPAWMQYKFIRPFREFCIQVDQDMGDNADLGLLKKHEIKYRECYEALKDCVSLLDENRLLMEFDMDSWQKEITNIFLIEGIIMF